MAQPGEHHLRSELPGCWSGRRFLWLSQCSPRWFRHRSGHRQHRGCREVSWTICSLRTSLLQRIQSLPCLYLNLKSSGMNNSPSMKVIPPRCFTTMSALVSMACSVTPTRRPAPASSPAWMPDDASSKTTQSPISKPSLVAPSRYGSGSGLPFVTSHAVTNSLGIGIPAAASLALARLGFADVTTVQLPGGE